MTRALATRDLSVCLPPRAARVRMLRALVGDAEKKYAPLPAALRRVVHRNYDRHVLPILQNIWQKELVPAVQKKLRFVSCHVYATSTYAVLLSAPRPPFLLRLIRKVALWSHLPPAMMSTIASRTLDRISRFLPTDVQRRTVQIAALIALIDQVLDHELAHLAPEQRALLLHRLFQENQLASNDLSPALHALLSLRQETERDLRTLDEKMAHAIAMHRLTDYVDAEVRGMTGVVDPSGLCWRMAGVIGTIDGIIFPIRRHVNEQVREWMIQVSLLIQVMDDWLDFEKDADDIRETPVLTGAWTFEDLHDLWNSTFHGVQHLVRAAGVANDDYSHFIAESYRYMIREVVDAMCDGVAD